MLQRNTVLPGGAVGGVVVMAVPREDACIQGERPLARYGAGVATPRIISGTPAQFVHFDVALSAMEGTGTKAGLGVVVAALSAGASGESKGECAATSRIKFFVPLVLPPERRGKA
jgi:hypothetical protein